MTALTGITSGSLEMIDVSHWDGTISWTAVKNTAGKSAAYMKATMNGGTYNTTTGANAGYTDPMFSANQAGCKQVGLPWGCYHYATPTSPYNQQEAINQADWFVDTVMNIAGTMGDMFPVLDIESPTNTGVLTPDQILNWCQAFISHVESRTGRQVMVYTGTWFIQQNNNFVYANGNANPMANCPLWVAEYASQATYVSQDGWQHYYGWQYSDTGTVAGVNSQCDLTHIPSSVDYLMPPRQPQGLVATAGNGQVSLDWQASTDADLVGYNVYENGVKINTSVIQAGTESYTIAGLTNGTQYSFYIESVDNYESSQPSNTVSSTPTNTAVSSTGGGTTTVTPTTTATVSATTKYPTYVSNDSVIQIICGELDFTPWTDYESISVDNNIIMTSDTIDLNIQYNPDVDQVKNAVTGAVVPATRPVCGQEIIWQNPKLIVTAPDGSQQPYREFAGVITEVTEDVEGMDLLYQIHAKSYVQWLDRHLVTQWYNEDHPETIIKKMVGDFSNGFTTYNVQNTNVTIIPQYFDYQKMSDSIKLIADQLEYGWYVDYYKDVHFYAAESFTSPLSNNLLNVDNDNESFGDLELIENGEQIYNKVFIRGFKTRSTSPILQTYQGDGQTTQWNVGYRFSSILTPTPDVTVRIYTTAQWTQAESQNFMNGSPTCGTALYLKKDIVDGAPEQQAQANYCYIHFTEHLLRIPNFTGGTPVNSGDQGKSLLAVPSGYVVAVKAYYMKDTVFLAQDPSSQAITANIEETDGVYEYSYLDKSLSNSTLSSVKAKGQLLIAKYKRPQITGSFNSYFKADSATGWRAGQWFTLITKRRFGGINKVMFVQRVTKTVIKNDSGGLITQNTVEFADSPYLV